LAPLAVLAILSLVRFIGCSSFTTEHNPTVETTPGPTGQAVADYSGTVKADIPVSYWRLQEKHVAEPSSAPTVPNTPVAGGKAKDEMAHNEGTYKAVIVPPPAPPPPPPPPRPPLRLPLFPRTRPPLRGASRSRRQVSSSSRDSKAHR